MNCCYQFNSKKAQFNVKWKYYSMKGLLVLLIPGLIVFSPAPARIWLVAQNGIGNWSDLIFHYTIIFT